MSTTLPPEPRNGSEGPVPAELQQNPKDCLACRVIGTGALGGVGIYALNQSRAHAPGSVVGKRIMAGVGVCTCSVSLRYLQSSRDCLCQASWSLVHFDGPNKSCCPHGYRISAMYPTSLKERTWRGLLEEHGKPTVESALRPTML